MKQAFVNCVCEKSEIMYLDIESGCLFKVRQENTEQIRDIYDNKHKQRGHIFMKDRIEFIAFMKQIS